MPYRPVLATTRALLLVASGFVLVAGLQLFVLGSATDRFFAWPIAPVITASFLGAGYWASLVLQFRAAAAPDWTHARIALPGVLVFTLLTLVATLLHIDRFKFTAAHLTARAASVAWPAVYLAFPVAFAAALYRQGRLAGSDPKVTQPLPTWYRAALVLVAAEL